MGKHFCKAFLKEGACLCLTDLDGKLVDQTLNKFDAAEKMIGAVVDVCKRPTIEASVEKMVAHFGRLDALVNVAGGSLYTPNKFQDIDEASWDKVVDVNLKGTFLCSQSAVEQFRKQGGGGKIVNVSALAGRWLGSLAGCHYTAAKAGVIGLTRHMAHELGPEGIYVNAIAPTITSDLSVSLGRAGRAGDPVVKDAIQRVIDISEDKGVIPGIHTGSVENAGYWIDRGMKMVGFKTDIKFILEICKDTVEKLRALV
jgi:NAD(P)-dependent dehydrogenase (short-subunit alcohol dehydrogenase family)